MRCRSSDGTRHTAFDNTRASYKSRKDIVRIIFNRWISHFIDGCNFTFSTITSAGNILLKISTRLPLDCKLHSWFWKLFFINYNIHGWFSCRSSKAPIYSLLSFSRSVFFLLCDLQWLFVAPLINFYGRRSSVWQAPSFLPNLRPRYKRVGPADYPEKNQ